MRKLYIIFLLLLLPFIAVAQDEEEAETIPYLELGENFAVSDLPSWEHRVEGETALFTNAALNAQIYVAAYESQDIESMIQTAIDAVYQGDLPAPIYSSRIAPKNGVWEYRLFNSGETSITAYGMLKSNRVYVILFIENSADYTAYQMAIRSSIPNAEGAAIHEAIETSSLLAIQQSLNPDFVGEIQATSNPNSDTETWLLSEYEDNIATASYLKNDIVYVTVLEGNPSLATELSNAFDTVFLGFVITPNNSEYLYLGLGFAGGIMLILIASIWLRYRNLHKDLQMIEQLSE
jgi:hypothetical protein